MVDGRWQMELHLPAAVCTFLHYSKVNSSGVAAVPSGGAEWVEGRTRGDTSAPQGVGIGMVAWWHVGMVAWPGRVALCTGCTAKMQRWRCDYHCRSRRERQREVQVDMAVGWEMGNGMGNGKVGSRPKTSRSEESRGKKSESPAPSSRCP